MTDADRYREIAIAALHIKAIANNKSILGRLSDEEALYQIELASQIAVAHMLDLTETSGDPVRAGAYYRTVLAAVADELINVATFHHPVNTEYLLSQIQSIGLEGRQVLKNLKNKRG